MINMVPKRTLIVRVSKPVVQIAFGPISNKLPIAFVIAIQDDIAIKLREAFRYILNNAIAQLSVYSDRRVSQRNIELFHQHR